MRKKPDIYIFPLIFDKITDFQVNKATTKLVRVSPFFLQHLKWVWSIHMQNNKKNQVKLMLPTILIETVGNVLK